MGIIAVSAGHHPAAKGASYQGVTEYDLTTRWADKICEYLKTFGCGVVRVPAGTLKSKVNFINSRNVDAAIEVHFNAGGNDDTRGCETLYCPGSVKGRVLARMIQGPLYRIMETRDRGVKEGWYRQDRPGVVDYKGDQDGDETINYFLLKTKCPAVIIEPEFIQAGECHINSKMHDGAWQIADALTRYVEIVL